MPSDLRVVLLLIPFAGVALCACAANDCDVGETRCQDNKAMVCDMPCAASWCGAQWEVQDCGDSHCIDTTENAFCAAAPVPDARCTGDQDVCDGDALINCYAGFVIGEEPCADVQPACVEAEGTAFCALSHEPRDACGDAAGTRAVCDGLDLLTCSHGFVVWNRMCTGACITLPGAVWNETFCALADEPEPRCKPEDPDAVRAYCDRGTAVSCHEGYADGAQVCPTRCVESRTAYTAVAYCNPSTADASVADEDAGL